MLGHTRRYVALLLQALVVILSGPAWAQAPLRGIHVAAIRARSRAPATPCRVGGLRFWDRDIPKRRPARGRQSTVEDGSEPSIGSINLRCIEVIA